MKGLPLVEDSRVKAGCPTFAVRLDGAIVGHKHPPGYLIPFVEGMRKSCLLFMMCPAFEKTGRFLIGFASFTEPFHKMKVGPMVDIHMILVRGLILVDSVFKVVFHRWKGKGCCQNVYDEIEQYKNNAKAFIQSKFISEVEEVDVDCIHIAYVNQISGNRLTEWVQEPSHFIQDGKKYYKAGKNGDYFCRDDPFPKLEFPAIEEYDYVALPKSTKLRGNYLEKSKSKLVKFIGSPSLRQQENSTTLVVYSIKRFYTNSLGSLEKPYFQAMHSPRECTTQLFAPISKQQRKELLHKMKLTGPVSPDKFNEQLIAYSDEFNAKPISFNKLVLNKVSGSILYITYLFQNNAESLTLIHNNLRFIPTL